jgi:hypothetical protein
MPELPEPEEECWLDALTFETVCGEIPEDCEMDETIGMVVCSPELPEPEPVEECWLDSWTYDEVCGEMP